MNRRQFLKVSGLAATGLAVGCGASTDQMGVAPGSSTGLSGITPSLRVHGIGGRQAADKIAGAIQALPPALIQGRSRLLATVTPSQFQLPSALIPPVQDQGVLESCGSFGLGYCLATGMAALANPGMDITQAANQSSSAYIYKYAYSQEGVANCKADQTGSDSGTDGTSYFDQLVQGGGNVVWATVPYPSASLSENAICLQIDQVQLGGSPIDSRFQLGGWNWFSNDLDTLKAHLMTGIPVGFLVQCYANFDDSFTDPNNSKTFVGTGKANDGGHFMCALGFDDSRGPNGAVYIQNSWGTGFGFQGRFWFDYVTFINSVEWFYVGVPVTTSGSGTPLATSGGTGGLSGQVTRAYQVANPDGRVHLVIHVELSRAIQLSAVRLRGPSGPQLEFAHRTGYRSGYLYASRSDGQFRHGTYHLEVASSAGDLLTGDIPIAALDTRPENDLNAQVTGSTGQPGSLTP